MSRLRNKQEVEAVEYCHDPRHDKPCRLPCVACVEDGCDTAVLTEPKGAQS